MKLQRVLYADLNSKQKEIYNFQKISSVLADYGFNCIKLADDWQGADFLAYHINGEVTYRVQLKSRLTIGKKYMGKNLCIAFPLSGHWYLIEHDHLVDLVGKTTSWLRTESWLVKGHYHSMGPSQALLGALKNNLLMGSD